MSLRWNTSLVFILGIGVGVLARQEFGLTVTAQQGGAPALGTPGAAPARTSDLELVERLVVLRRNYQRTLEQLRFYYMNTNDQERTKMAEEELISYHRIRKHAFNIDLEVPPPTLQGTMNIPEANALIIRALGHKDKGWGNDYIDNQRRAEILLQELLTKYPQSNKISVAAYWLGDIYESKANEMPRRASWYYARCYQWNTGNYEDARLREARIYDHKLNDRTKALELYRDVTNYDHVPAHIAEAKKRINELSGKR